MNIDDSAWPLVVATLPANVGMESIDVLESYFAGCFARGERYAMITDTRALSKIPDALWRKRITEWMNEPSFRRKNGRYNVGSATIVSSATVRAAATALQWFWKPPSAQYFAADMLDATDWCIAQLRAFKVPISPQLSRFHDSLSRRAVGHR